MVAAREILETCSFGLNLIYTVDYDDGTKWWSTQLEASTVTNYN